MAKDKQEKRQKQKKRGILFQIESKIGSSVVFVMLIVAFLVILLVRSTVMTANDTQLELESESAALQIEKYFAPFERMVEQQALNLSVLEMLDTLSSEQTFTDSPLYDTVVNQLIDNQQLDDSNILATWIASVNANALMQSDRFVSDESFELTARPYYVCTQTKQTVLTEPYIDASTGQQILSAAAPILAADGTVTGVSGMDISLEDIISLMHGYTIGEEGYVMLLSSNGTFIYHPDTAWINASIEDMNISQNVLTALKNSSEQLLKYTLDGESKYGFITPVGNTGLYAFSSIPKGQYYSSLTIAILLLICVFAFGFLVIVFGMRKTAVKIVKPLSELNETALQLAEGNLEVALNVDSQDEVGDLGRSIKKTVDRLKEYIDYIDEISEVLASMANGKLSIQLKYAYVGEFQKVKEALINISDSMNEVMTNISESANQVSLGSEDLAKAAQGLAEGAESQAAAVEELLASATSVAEQVESNRNDSEQSAKDTQEVTMMMDASKLQMEQMGIAMSQIQESSQKVVGIIQTIEDIAEQTNLLSLNASIEAARAGEAGKGFAVVAGEIGNLATESARAVNTTRNLIGVSLEEIKKGTTLAQEVVASINLAVEKIDAVNLMIQNTARSAEDQLEHVNHIRDGVEEIAHSVQDNSAMAEETSATSEELAASADTLNKLVSTFELK